MVSLTLTGKESISRKSLKKTHAQQKMGKTIIDVYSMYVSPIPAKNDWMVLVQRMFSYLKKDEM